MSLQQVPFQNNSSAENKAENLSVSSSPHSTNTPGAYMPLGNIINSSNYKLVGQNGAHVDKKPAGYGSGSHVASQRVAKGSYNSQQQRW
jgi:hypothetical protein